MFMIKQISYCPTKLENMDSVFVTATFASIAPWMALIRATQEQLPIAPWTALIRARQEQLPMDAGVELTGTYLQRVAVANTGFMSAPKLVISKPFKIESFDLATK